MSQQEWLWLGSEWPTGSGLWFTASLAPVPCAQGFRLADSATALMHAMTDCLPVGYCLANQFPDEDGEPCLPPRAAALGRGRGR
ncbi:protein of unknown function (plasmid) [Cupriavidus taiwanensis]|nr:protein of unknown function [Cupriavidus taiwanensis]